MVISPWMAESERLMAVRGVTLDIDASQIVAELSGMVLHEEFREGNVSPGARHVPFLENCLKHLPSGLMVNQLRADSASYQADVFNWCMERGIGF
jgi:hypothetical protein